MATKTVLRMVDELIAGVASVGSRCFDLNSHDGLTMEQQTAFFMLGRTATFTVQRLTDKFTALLSLAATADGKKLIAITQAARDTAVTSCDAVINASSIPPLPLILAANTESARALDLADDILVAAG